MLMDINIQFSSAQAITATAVSTNTLDLLTGQKLASNSTYTVSPAMIIGAPNQSGFVYGADIGLGRGVGTPTVVVTTGGVNFATGTSLQIQFTGAVDGGSGTISSNTFVVYIQTDTIATSLLVKNTRIASFDWPVRKVAQAMPRFVQLNYVVGGSNFTTGSVTADVTLGPDTANPTLGQYPSNY